MSVLSKPYFHDEALAFAHVESVLWPEGPSCPHCGNVGKIYDLKNVTGKTGKVRHGLRKCGECRKQFTVRIGTIFESSHIPLHKWLQAIYLMTSSKKGISSNQLHRVLEITLKSAWFLSHRIREAMRSDDLTPMGGEGKFVEADETFIGRLKGVPQSRGFAHKNVVLTLVERGGRARSFHVADTSISKVVPIVRDNIAQETALMTDEARHYVGVGKEFASHGAVHHAAKEYARYVPGATIHTNTVEGFYSIFKRGMKGIYQHCSEGHLHRYLAEFDFRYSNRVKLGCDDGARALRALEGVKGRRLIYQQPCG